jgi:hypothetical protein
MYSTILRYVVCRPLSMPTTLPNMSAPLKIVEPSYRKQEMNGGRWRWRPFALRYMTPSLK